MIRWFLLVASWTWVFEAGAADVQSLDQALAGKDYLAARVLIKALKPNDLTRAQWLRVRQLIHQNPTLGWDLLLAWDLLKVKKFFTPAEEVYQRAWARADRLMSSEKFTDAFSLYQKLAKRLRRQGVKYGGDNFFGYQKLLHSMARALYGGNRFNEALDVYDWISPHYDEFKQVQFEKMWAAFRADRIDRANGAIASQTSAYFSKYQEPETYLVQLYLYKRMCREAESEKIIEQIKFFKDALKSGAYDVKEWSRRDIGTLALRNLVFGEPRSIDGLISAEAREAERKLILTKLQSRFEADKKRLKEQMEVVQAYVNLLKQNTRKELPLIVTRPDLKAILADDREKFNVDDSEEWLDELGKHLFIGESQCIAKGP